MRQRNAMTQPRTYADDVMTEERTMPTIRLAPMPMPQRAPKRRPTQKPLKRVARAVRVVPEKEEEPEEKCELYYKLQRSFAQVRLMMDGKLPKKSLDEFLEEVRLEEEQDELRNSHH